jgi:hypothetical protein
MEYGAGLSLDEVERIAQSLVATTQPATPPVAARP